MTPENKGRMTVGRKISTILNEDKRRKEQKEKDRKFLESLKKDNQSIQGRKGQLKKINDRILTQKKHK